MPAQLVLDPTRLRRERLLAGLTQLELCERSGVHHVTISRLESGKAAATVPTIAKLAGALALPVAALADVVA